MLSCDAFLRPVRAEPSPGSASSQKVSVRVDNAGVDVGVMLCAVNAELRDRWRLERRLAGGWHEGAYLLSRPDGSRAVLKWRASEPERLLGARERVDVARARGWPAPAWLAVGLGPAGGAWVVQEYIDDWPPPRLSDAVAEQMIEIFGLQASMFPGAVGGWGQWAWGWCSRTGMACVTGRVRRPRGLARPCQWAKRFYTEDRHKPAGHDGLT